MVVSAVFTAPYFPLWTSADIFSLMPYNKTLGTASKSSFVFLIGKLDHVLVVEGA